ncbi:GFA family protein [Altererythrobacter sp.]|uniref:GFA family protein n=1 Tax=Altererythrobacter sp. TaxID=1872480 RepID=UPI003D0239DF
MPKGRCHCGAVVYSFQGGVRHSSVCHCEDCRRCAGATGVAWVGVPSDDFAIEQGSPVEYRSSADTSRYFCGQCGTGLTYVNENVSPGTVDIQTATLDDPEEFPPDKQVQMGDALSWERNLHELPSYDRFPSNS